MKHWTDRIRQEHKKSMYEISRETGISESAFSKSKTRRSSVKNMPFKNVSKIAKSLGMSVDEFLNKYGD